MKNLLDHIPSSTIEHFTQQRTGEIKLGQTLTQLYYIDDLPRQLKSQSAKYVLLGIPEDIGPRANYGRSGTATMFLDALRYLCNIQDNQYLHGKDILLLGQIKTHDLIREAKTIKPTEEGIAKLRALVSEVDKRVAPIVQCIVEAGKIPIVIGGGHNNAYPIIKGVSKGVGKSIATVNIDPHADLRPSEGRHSGNGFTFAIDEGFLEKYFMFGLHQNYNTNYTFNKVNSIPAKCEALCLDTILFKYSSNLQEAFTEKVCAFIKEDPCGLELDMDSIPHTASSAKTPEGISSTEIRKLINTAVHRLNLKYFHIAEGIPSNITLTGKLISYFITDFIKASILKK